MIILALLCDGATMAHFSAIVDALVNTAMATVSDFPYWVTVAIQILFFPSGDFFLKIQSKISFCPFVISNGWPISFLYKFFTRSKVVAAEKSGFTFSSFSIFYYLVTSVVF